MQVSISLSKQEAESPSQGILTPLVTPLLVVFNGSRLPWHFGVDMRVDKDFALSFGKKHKDAPEGIKPKRPLYLKAIITVNNLLNTREILSVYGYTGKPDDNGYLTSAQGLQSVPQQVNPQSYTDLYTIYSRDPGKLNYARTINFSLEFNF